MKEIQKHFCEHCGARMTSVIESADGWMPYWAKYIHYPKFNSKTGEENLMEVFRCPNGWVTNFWGKKKYNEENHSIIGLKKNFI